MSAHAQQRFEHTRCKTTLLATTGLLLGFLAASAPSANAAFVGSKLVGSNFEIDTNANLVADAASPSIDWLDGAALRITPAADKASGGGDDSFGQGTSESDAVPTVTDGSIPPNKSDLKNFGVFQERAGNASFLHLFWSRVQDPSGTTNMDFEFNKSQTASSNGVTPLRSPGDLLLTYDLGNGGTVATLSKRTWGAGGWSSAAALTGNAIGSVNTSAIAAAASGGIGSLSPRTFGEASLNLASVFGAGCTSFGSAYLKSRSSDSFSAAIKDFIAPIPVNVSNCGSVSIHKQDDAGTLLGGAVFTLYTNVAPLTGGHGVGDTATSYTCTTSVTTGNCTISSVPFGDYWIVETTTPANHDTAADQAVSVSAGGNSPTGTFTFVDPRQQGSIIVKKTNPAGGVLAGAGFTVTPGTLVMNESTTGVFCVDGLLYGSYTVSETTVPSGFNGAADQTVSVSTKSTCAGRLAGAYTPDLTFVDSPAPGTINVAKTDDAANPMAGAGFTLYNDLAPVGSYQAGTDTQAVAQRLTGAGGTLQFDQVPLGNYCVVETSTPTGYATAAPQCVTVGLGATAATGQTINLSFVDPRQHKVIVIVCHEGTNTLDSSPVTVDGTTKSSLATAPGGFTAAQLCGLGGATFGGRGHGTTSASVDVQ